MIKSAYEIIDELLDLINKPVLCANCKGKFIRTEKKQQICPICRQKGKQNEYAEKQIRESLRLAQGLKEGETNGSSRKD